MRFAIYIFYVPGLAAPLFTSFALLRAFLPLMATMLRLQQRVRRLQYAAKDTPLAPLVAGRTIATPGKCCTLCDPARRRNIWIASNLCTPTPDPHINTRPGYCLNCAGSWTGSSRSRPSRSNCGSIAIRKKFDSGVNAGPAHGVSRVGRMPCGW